MPKRETQPPKDDTALTLAVLVARIKSDANSAKRLAKRDLKELGKRHADLSDAQIAVLTETAMQAADAWRDLSNAVRASTSNKRGHLSVVA
jgi:hypothetical protein